MNEIKMFIINNYNKNEIITDYNDANSIVLSIKYNAINYKLLTLSSNKYTKCTLFYNLLLSKKKYWYGKSRYKFAKYVYYILLYIIKKLE